MPLIEKQAGGKQKEACAQSAGAFIGYYLSTEKYAILQAEFMELQGADSVLYTVLRIEEDMAFGCEERAENEPVMAVVTLQDEAGQVQTLRYPDGLLYERGIEPGCTVEFDDGHTLLPVCRFRVGDVVRHFKREGVSPESAEYLYRILAFAQHTETGEKLVIYQALYPPYKTCARPYSMFCSPVDRTKYPQAKQYWRFEPIPVDFWPK